MGIASSIAAAQTSPQPAPQHMYNVPPSVTPLYACDEFIRQPVDDVSMTLETYNTEDILFRNRGALKARERVGGSGDAARAF